VPISPIKKMVKVLYNLQDGTWMEPKPHPLFTPEYGRWTADPLVEVDVFHAGSKVNTIPNEARAQIDIRLLPDQMPDEVLEELDEALDELRAEDPDLDISYRILNQSKNPLEVSPDHWMVQAILETCSDLDQPEPELVGSIGGGRGALAPLGPVLHFGAGGGNGAHAPNEWAPVEAPMLGAKLHAHLYTKVLTGE
jgi:acetylornithine deacetylase/succinyl-diaminopimelate desuccinylase-like protein